MDTTTGFTSNPSFSPAPPVGSTVFTPPKAPPAGGLKPKNIILIGILVLVLAGLVFGFSKARSFLSKAVGEGGCTPENVRENNLTSSSVEIVFQTSKACMAEIVYGISREGMLLQVPEAMASLNHRIRLSPLLPSTTYYYQIKVEGKKTEPVRSFLTMAAAARPTEPPVTPTTGPASRFTQTDFEAQFGTSNPLLDIDKNGVVNIRDWLLYQKTQVR